MNLIRGNKMFLGFNFTFVYYFLFNITLVLAGTLNEIVTKYDTINRADFRHRVIRRDVSDAKSVESSSHTRYVDFVSHGRTFHIVLTQSANIFSTSFSAVTVDEFGNETPFHVDKDSFYEGYVEDDDTSFITAHVEQDGIITASIDTANETYVVEPMWRHVDGNPSHDMIVYKVSDVKWNLTAPVDPTTGKPRIAHCGNHDINETDIKTDVNNDNVAAIEEDDDVKIRSRRATDSCKKITESNTCKLHLIADNKFYRQIGGSNKNVATNFMIQVIKRVDNIYRETCWDNVGKGIGVQVEKVTVHDTEFKSGFNTKKYWQVDSLLTEFSRKDHSNYCLAHLFTFQDFSDGVIGLAYVGSKHTRIGGVCSPKSRDRTTNRYHNCGLTTFINWGRRLTTLEATLVTTHEIGHNFGSSHDPKLCSANSGKGRYVMYATSVTGEKPNNKKFSICSTAQIGGVLNYRRMAKTPWGKCFSDTGSLCGNGIVEKDEECDSYGIENKCCTADCKLKPGKKCNDGNSACCTNCQITPANTKVCRGEFAFECKGKTMCNGTSIVCPEKAPILKDVDCIAAAFRKGRCNVNGTCVSMCAIRRLEPCICSAGPSACKVCCKDKTGVCKPSPDNLYENDGVQCNFNSTGEATEDGFCSNRTCTPYKKNVKDSFKNLLLDFTLDKAVRFMRNNIVITILFFSLLIWVPAGCIVSAIDRNKEEEENEKIANMDTLVPARTTSFKKKKGESHKGNRKPHDQ